MFGNRVRRALCMSLVGINVGNANIPVKKTAKSLGLTLDDDMKFGTHVSLCISSAFCRLKRLYNIRHYFNQNTKLLLCDSLVLSVFNHCLPVFGPCLRLSDVQRIQRLQNACVRFAYGIRKYEHISSALNTSGWLDMAGRILYNCGNLYYKIIKSHKPPYLYNKISFRTDVHTLNLRHRFVITPPQHRTSSYRGSFTFMIAKFYNQFTPDVRTLSCGQFGSWYRQYLLSLRDTGPSSASVL